MASAPSEVWGDLATTAFVESSPLFKGLDPETRSDVLQLARLVAYAPGELVSAEGDDTFLLMVEGAAAAQVDGVEIALLERGATFGEGRVLGGGRAALLVARTDVKVVAFPAPVIAAVAERSPKMKKLMEAVLAAREREASARLGS
jgi:CRP-like cAMP-binding protein